MIDELTLGVVPFRGSWAVQRGLLTERVLRDHRYRRLFHDIYLLASAPADLAARSQGATLPVPGRGVLSGYSAADLLGARCAPADANVELTVPGGDLREQPGLTVHRDLLADDEVTDAAGLLTTTALRTAWDLARCCPQRRPWWRWMRWPESGGSPRARCSRSMAATRGRAGGVGCPE